MGIIDKDKEKEKQKAEKKKITASVRRPIVSMVPASGQCCILNNAPMITTAAPKP